MVIRTASAVRSGSRSRAHSVATELSYTSAQRASYHPRHPHCHDLHQTGLQPHPYRLRRHAVRRPQQVVLHLAHALRTRPLLQNKLASRRRGGGKGVNGPSSSVLALAASSLCMLLTAIRTASAVQPGSRSRAHLVAMALSYTSAYRASYHPRHLHQLQPHCHPLSFRRSQRLAVHTWRPLVAHRSRSQS